MCKFLDKKKKKNVNRNDRKHGGSSFNSETNHEAKKNDGKIFDIGRLSKRTKLLLIHTLSFPPYFFKNDRLRSFQFREKSHASC